MAITSDMELDSKQAPNLYIHLTIKIPLSAADASSSNLIWKLLQITFLKIVHIKSNKSPYGLVYWLSLVSVITALLS